MMKRIYVLFLLMLGVVGMAVAQSHLIIDESVMTMSDDTIKNSVTTTFTTAAVYEGYGKVTASLVLTKVSGTVGGTCNFYKSNYPTAGWSLADTTTFTFTNTATQGITWESANDALHYRVTCVPSGTMLIVPKVRVVAKRD